MITTKPLDSERYKLIIPVLALALVLTGCDRIPPPLLTESSGVWTSGFPANATIGVSFPQSTSESWDSRKAKFSNSLETAGFTLMMTYADGGVYDQQNQILSMIYGGAKVIIVNAIDGSQLGDQLAAAKQAGITIIAFDRLLTKTPDVDIYITYDRCQAGRNQATSLLEGLAALKGAGPYNIELIAGAIEDGNALVYFNCAMEILQPKIDDGTLIIPSGQLTREQVATVGWRPDNAKKRLGAILSDFYNGASLDGILSPNDTLARAAISALEDASLPIPVVTGQDSEEESVRWVANGLQYSTINNGFDKLVDEVAGIVKQLQQGQEITFTDTTTFDNGVKIVPAYLLDPLIVTQDNVCTAYDPNTGAGKAAAETPLCRGG